MTYKVGTIEWEWHFAYNLLILNNKNVRKLLESVLNTI